MKRPAARVRKPPPEQRKGLDGTLARAIAASGLSHSELARRAGVENRSVSRFMRGQFDLSLSNAVEVARVLRLELVERGKTKTAPAPKPQPAEDEE